MWNWLKDIGQKALENGAAHMQHRAFIQSLFNMPQEQAYWTLKQKIDELDDQGIQMFSGVLAGMMNEAQQAAQQGTGDDAWGTSFEDRMAYSMARIQSGIPAQQNTQAQMHLQGLNAIAHFANQFYQEKLTRAAQPQFAAPSPVAAAPQATTGASANAVDPSQLEAMIEKLVQGDQVDPQLITLLSSLNDPALIEKGLAKLKEMGADEVAPIMNIADYYQPRNIKYELKWPLSTSLPVAFDRLDEATQFHVLFAEWTRREMQGSFALNNGDLVTAESTFNECLERAEQLAVPELMARSYEGFMQIAQRSGDRAAELKWITAAKKARAEA